MAIYDRLGINREWKLPPPMQPSDWSERNVSIAVGNALPGLISYSDLKYQEQIVNLADSRAVNWLTIMSAAQCGKTMIGLVLSAYYILHKPRSIIVVQPTETDVRVFLASKFDPLMRANPTLARAFVKPRSHEGVFNNQFRDFRGGHLMLCWGGSATTLRGRSAPVCIVDEVDGMATLPEGHPADLVSERSATFGDQRLVIEMSTPTDKGVSRIDSRFQLGDMRRWLMRCVNCGDYREPDWQDVEWTEENPLTTARWVCRECGYSHKNYERIEASRKGEWRATNPFINHASFHISGLASPLRRLGDMTVQYQALIDDGKPFITFINTVLGEPYSTDAASANDLDLESRAEDYEAEVPEGVRGLTAAVDVQHNRLEVAVYGWDKNSRSWVIAYSVLYGNPSESEVWESLGSFLMRGWNRKDESKQHLITVGIDTRYETMHVENFITAWRRRLSRIGCRIYAIRGTNSVRNPSVIQRSTNRYKVGKLSIGEMVNVNAHANKVHAMRLLNVTEPDAPGYCRFNIVLDQEFYDSLTAEEMQTTLDRRGYPKIEWVKLRERNEAFDLFRYAHAMAMLSGVFHDDGDEILNLAGSNPRRPSRHFW